MGRILAASLPALALVVWSAAASASTALAGGALLLLLTPALAVAGWLLCRQAPVVRGAGAQAAVVVCGAVAVAAHLLRLWSVPYPEESGIVPFLYSAAGFWWPALFVAAVAHVLDRRLAGNVTPWWHRLLAAAAGAAAGLLLIVASNAVWFSRVDRYALAVDVDRSLGWLAQGEDWDYALRDGVLRVSLDATARAGEPSVDLVRWSEQLRAAALDLTRRHDVRRVNLVVEARGRTLFHIDVSDDDRHTRASPVPQVVDPAAVAHGGRLDAESLRRMQRPYLDPAETDPFGAWERRFSVAVEGDEVRVRFDPPGPLGADTVRWHAAAWESANAIVNETARAFPGIARFRVALPGLEAIAERADIPPEGLRLQSRLRETERVLTFEVTATGSRREPLVPERFYGEPVPGFQIAVTRSSGELANHATGVLYEPISLQPGMLFVLSIDADGGAQIVLETNDGVIAGPATVAPGGRVTLAGETIANRGFVARSRFAAFRRS